MLKTLKIRQQSEIHPPSSITNDFSHCTVTHPNVNCNQTKGYWEEAERGYKLIFTKTEHSL